MSIMAFSLVMVNAGRQTERHADRRTDMMMLIVAFRNSANAPNKRRTTKVSARCEPANPSVQRLQTYVLDRTATTIG